MTEKELKLCIYGSEIHILLRKEGLPLATTRNHNIFLKFRPKRAWNYAYLARKIQFSPSSPLDPVNTLHKRSVCSLRWLLSPHVEILPKHMDSTPPIIHFTHYTLAISQYVMFMCVKKNIKMIIFRICPYDWFVNITLHQWLEMTSSNKTSLVQSFSPTSLLKTLTGGGSKKFRVRWKGGSKKLRVSWKGGSKSFGYSERGGQKKFWHTKIEIFQPPLPKYLWTVPKYLRVSLKQKKIASSYTNRI